MVEDSILAVKLWNDCIENTESDVDCGSPATTTALIQFIRGYCFCSETSYLTENFRARTRT